MYKWWMLLTGVFNMAVASDSVVLLDMAKKKMADPATYEQALRLGEDRVVLCGYCHGKDGNSVRTYIPNLASQTPEYLINQFESFARGERESPVMSKLANILSDDERVNIALYYSQLKAEPRMSQQPQHVAEGERLYSGKCAVCHGVDANGNHAMPRLAGQPEDYLMNTLEAFKEGKRRTNSPMRPVAAELESSDIQALSAYLTTQP
ncbi:c-type cytochrome [Endozoicomonas arenosclerae]|uniref:c-type cytochrome n=1 Tax=Endozoicomonas arenosclerae TaxID=1633495 RepID=UPI000781BEE0|nr:cytochrome c [Endozoicomonas arenosclerae]